LWFNSSAFLFFSFVLPGEKLRRMTTGLHSWAIIIFPFFAMMAAAAATTTSSTLKDLVHRVSQLSPVNQRAVAAVVGASVADAATRPFHWLYDRQKLYTIVGDKDPCFWPHSCSPFYDLPTGRRSCYNDLGVVMLRSLRPTPAAAFDHDTYVGAMKSLFSPVDSEYAEALRRRKEAYTPEKRLADREPVPGPWQQGAVTAFLDCLERGEAPAGSPDSRETDGLCTTIPLICRLTAEEAAGHAAHTADARDAAVVRAAALLSSNPFALRHTLAAARVLRGIVLGGAGAATPDAVQRAVVDEEGPSPPGGKVAAVKEGEAATDYLRAEWGQVAQAVADGEDTTDAVERWGRQCANPGSFQGAMLAVVSSASFTDGVRKVIMGGGCNCSRANLAGACLGAAHGFGGDAGIPFEWLEKTDRIDEILTLALEKVAT